MSKISIRFYKEHKVRAVWDEDHNHWWFSVLDIVGAINQQDDHEKNRNYWKYLKAKLRKEQSEVVSDTTQLKLTAADGKKYNTDVISQAGEPPIIINYTSTTFGDNASVFGLGMLDNALLSELIANIQDICFHAITCMKDVICKREYCIPATLFAKLCAGKNEDLNQTENKETKSKSPNPECFSNLELKPNPTTGEVNVIGTTDEVVEFPPSSPSTNGPRLRGLDKDLDRAHAPTLTLPSTYQLPTNSHHCRRW